MATQSSDTAKLYALTAAGACSVTLTQGLKSVTWQPLRAAGQATVLVPAGAVLHVSEPEAMLSPIPFKAALGTGNGSAEGAGTSAVGEDICEPDEMLGSQARVVMKHATWVRLPQSAESCIVQPSADAAHACCMQLLLTPFTDCADGWLQGVEWVGGEPSLIAGFSYIVTLVQVSTNRVLANLNMPFTSLA